MASGIGLLKADRKDEIKAAATYAKREKEFPSLKSMFAEIRNDEKSHRKLLEKRINQMPGKITSGKQFRFLEAMAHGKKSKKKKGAGPSEEVAEKMLNDESHETKSRFAKAKR
jgi:rubrerythrin